MSNKAQAFERFVARGIPAEVLISNRSEAAQTSLSSGGSLSTSYRNQHKALVTCGAVRLLYSNRRNLTSTGETTPAFAYTLKATLETPAGMLLPVYFGGVREPLVAAGAEVLSDPIPVRLVAGDRFWVRTRPLAGTLGDTWPIGGGGNTGALTEGGHVSGDQVDGAAALFVGTAVPAGPAAILGVSSDPTTVSAVIMGDSIGHGTGDATSADGDYGFLARVLTSLGIPHFKFAAPSLAFEHWIGTTDAERVTKTVFLRQHIARMKPTHAVMCMGNNDIHSAATLEQVQTRFLNWVSWFDAMGMQVICTTLSPRTTGTWTTYAGQTEASATQNLNRRAFNEWLRRSRPHSAIVDVWDYAAAMEAQIDADTWRVDLGAMTNDGTHPNTLGHATAAAYILSQPARVRAYG